MQALLNGMTHGSYVLLNAHEATSLPVQIEIGVNELDHLLWVDGVMKNDVGAVLIQMNGIKITMLPQACARVPSTLMRTALKFTL